MNNVINWFEIPVADMDRAVAFYEPVMQVTLRRAGGFPASGSGPWRRVGQI